MSKYNPNQKIGVVTLLEYIPGDRGNSTWNCLCECGKTRLINPSNLEKNPSSVCECPGIDNNEITLKYSQYKTNAKKKHREFLITRIQFENLILSKCHYCGSLDGFNGVDRVDNSKGYNLKNVVSCCYFCNQAKHIFDALEFDNWIDRLVDNRLKIKTERYFDIPEDHING